MRTWKEVIKEATAAEIQVAGKAALRDERKKNKEEKTQKGKSSYQDYLERQLAFKRQKYEDQKKAQLNRLKKGKVQKHVDAAKSSISGIKTQQISDKDKEGTAYSKLIGNVGSAAVGVGGAVVHGVKALAAKRNADAKAKAAEGNQPEKKEKKPAGRPSGKKSQSQSQSQETDNQTSNQITGASEPKKLVPATKRLVPATKRLPPSGGVPEGSRGPKPRSLGQRARKNPALKAGLIAQRAEEYSNWREELIIEVEDNKGKIEKKKIVDVMPKDATNKIDINPNETSIKEAYKDEEGGMAHNELSTMERAIKSLRKKIKAPNQQLPAWVQSKISKATDYIDTAADYMASETKLKEEGPVLSVGRGEKLSVERGGGLTKKGRDKYNRATGAHLQAPVTGDVKPGSKAAKRRKNFCSRSRSWKGERGLAARRRWKC